MNKKFKILIAIGGTGGHVFPGCHLAQHLIEKKFDVELVTDKRGVKFLKNYQFLKISVLPAYPIKIQNIFSYLFSLILIFFSIIRSLIFLILKKPSLVFGMGGYASFPLCIAASILKIRFIIYENNLIIGKANKKLLPFSKKILVSYKDLEGISKKYQNKLIEIGNIINKNIINFSKKYKKNTDAKKISLLILGGSQAAKIFAEKLPNIFLNCSNKGINLKIYQHCLPSQNVDLESFYRKNKLDFKIFNFSENLIEYFIKTDLAITRSGSSILAELTNANIPFIAVPLPSAADNHQFKNALFYHRKDFAFLLEEQDLNDKLLNFIKKLSEDKSILNKTIDNQRQHSDKNVYKNIDQVLKEFLNEKN